MKVVDNFMGWLQYSTFDVIDAVATTGHKKNNDQSDAAHETLRNSAT